MMIFIESIYIVCYSFVHCSVLVTSVIAISPHGLKNIEFLVGCIEFDLVQEV